MDSYQAIYDATRSRIRNGDAGQAIGDAVRSAFEGASYLWPHAQQEIYRVSGEMTRPSVLLRPHLAPDGNKWSALYGDDLMSGVCGFGNTPDEAMRDFDEQWLKAATPSAHKCPRCGEPNPDRMDRDGCRDPDCPERY